MSTSIDLSKFLAGLKQAEDKIRAAALRGMDQAGEHILGIAKERSPYDTGALQKSATAERAKEGNSSITKTIGFNTKYAAVVHETWQQGKIRSVTVKYTNSKGKTRRRTETRGNKNTLARQKFLESALREEGDKVAQLIVNAVRAAGG